MVDESAAPSIGGPIQGTRAGQMRDDTAVRMALQWVPAGSFVMGSPIREKGRFPNEDQVHVTLTQGFWIGKYEVTQSQWQAMMRTSPWHGLHNVKEGKDFPATFVSWDDAVEFCRTLTKAEREAGRLPPGWEYTLPTEAQWEYACRAGTTTRFSFGDDEARLAKYAWYEANAKRVQETHAHRVGQKEPNAWGLCDMHGNVLEWCLDEDHSPPQTDFQRAQYAAHGQPRVMVGGSWMFEAESCRSAFHSANWASNRCAYLGFRVVLCRVNK
jgi:formylglycine-generating enzyme required for sulfatase activity